MNTHRIELRAGDPAKWVKFSEVASLAAALRAGDRLQCSVRVLDLLHNEVVAEWVDGKRVR